MYWWVHWIVIPIVSVAIGAGVVSLFKWRKIEAFQLLWENERNGRKLMARRLAELAEDGRDY